MSQNSNGPEMVETSRVRESNAVVAEAIVPQPRRRWTAHRLETPPVPDSWPKYGTQEWYDLDTRDPKKRLALFEAAESWRLHQLREAEEQTLIDTDPDEWWRQNMADARAWAASTVRRLNIARTRTRAELDAAAAPRPPHQLQATDGWPAVAIPGQPGHHLTYNAQKEAA